VVGSIITTPGIPLLQTLLRIDAIRKAVNAHGGFLLLSLISKGDVSCVAELLRLADARALLERRVQMPTGMISIFDLINHAPRDARQAIRETMQAAWNASLKESDKKQ
jgi:hypothetical protein